MSIEEAINVFKESPSGYVTDAMTRLGMSGWSEGVVPVGRTARRFAGRAVTLKYGPKRERVITGIRRISKPGLRVYAQKTDIPRVLGGLGIVIVSTSKGIMTGSQAKQAQLGGEILAYVW